MIGKIKEWLRLRKERNLVSCKVRLGKYIYTITARCRSKIPEQAQFLWTCQSLANHLKVTGKFPQRSPEAIAEDWLVPQIEAYSYYSKVIVTWEEVKPDAKKT